MDDYTFSGDYSTERRGKNRAPYNFMNTLEMNGMDKVTYLSHYEVIDHM